MIDLLLRLGILAVTICSVVAMFMDGKGKHWVTNLIMVVFCISALLSVVFFDGVSDE